MGFFLVLLVLARFFVHLHGRSSNQALASRLGLGGSTNDHCTVWLKLVPLGRPREVKVKPEVVFDVVDADGRASEFRECSLESLSVVSGDREKQAQRINVQTARLVKAKSSSLQIIFSDELKQIPRNRKTHLLLWMLCGSSKRSVCVRFPAATDALPVVASSRLRARHLLGVEIQENQTGGTHLSTLIAVLVSAAGVVILITVFVLGACLGKETGGTTPKLLSLSQTDLHAPLQNTSKGSNAKDNAEAGTPKNQVNEGTLDPSLATVKVVNEENNLNEKALQRPEAQTSASPENHQSDLGDLTPNDVKHSDVTHGDVTSRDVTPAVNAAPPNVENEREARAEVKESRRSWQRSRSKEDRPDATKPDEEHKEKKSKKMKLSFMKSKRSSLERTEPAPTHSDNAPISLSVADRPRAPTPTPIEHHPRELPLPPPAVIGSRTPRKRQLSAPGALSEDDQYEVVQFDDNRPASTTDVDDSYESVTIRTRATHDALIERTASFDTTYDVIGDGPSERPASELYEVVDIEGKVGTAADGEEDTYEVVGGEEKNDGVSSSDAYEEVKRGSSTSGEVQVSLKEEKNEDEEVDPKYAKVRKSVEDGDAECSDVQLTVEGEEGVGGGADPKYAKVRNRNLADDDNDPKYSKVRHRTKKTANESAGSEAGLEVPAASSDTAVSPGSRDDTYEEVESAPAKRPAAARPTVQKHASTPELACSVPAVHSDGSAPPAPSLDLLKEVADASSRPRAFTEGKQLKERKTDGVCDYQYAQVDRTKKRKVSGEPSDVQGSGDGSGDGEASDDEPPPLPPIYVSLPKTDEEGGSREGEGDERKTEVPPESGLYDEVSPSPGASAPPEIAPPCAPGNLADSADPDYETVEEMMTYTVTNGSAGKQSAQDPYEAVGDISSDCNVVESAQTSANKSPRENVPVASAPVEDPHYEPVEVRKNGR